MIYNGMATRRRVRIGTVLNTLVVVALGLALAVPLAVGQNTGTQDKDKTSSGKSTGFILSEDATAKDVGLPIYPGAHRPKDTSDESSALQMGLWGGSSGFKLGLLKLESDDSPEKIAAFYRKALARYGRVLDCGNGSVTWGKSDSADSGEIKCDDDHPAAGGFTLKAGTKQSQHIAAVEPNGRHTKISLVYLWAPKSEKQQN